VSWYAELALRRRVSMSAIGSVIDMAVLAFPVVVSGEPDPFACTSSFHLTINVKRIRFVSRTCGA
jgi:hypothetical protein